MFLSSFWYLLLAVFHLIYLLSAPAFHSTCHFLEFSLWFIKQSMNNFSMEMWCSINSIYKLLWLAKENWFLRNYIYFVVGFQFLMDFSFVLGIRTHSPNVQPIPLYFVLYYLLQWANNACVIFVMISFHIGLCQLNANKLAGSGNCWVCSIQIDNIVRYDMQYSCALAPVTLH